jgi:hypothetical protein
VAEGEATLDWHTLGQRPQGHCGKAQESCCGFRLCIIKHSNLQQQQQQQQQQQSLCCQPIHHMPLQITSAAPGGPLPNLTAQLITSLNLQHAFVG